MPNFIHIVQGNVEFFGAYTLEFHIAILMAIIVVATTFDIREHRIPNWLVASGLLFAIAHHVLSPFGQGAAFTLLGMAVGIAALLPLYAMRTMGAGDVKLMGMVGAFLGAGAGFSAVLATMIAGGILALAASAYKRALPQLVGNLRTMLIQRDIRRMGGAGSDALPAPPSVGKLPYAVAIAAGTAVQVFMLRP